MKKVLFTIGIIAVLVGVAFAGMAASSGGTPPYDTILAKLTTLDANVTALNKKVTSIEGNLTAVKTTVYHIAEAITPIGQVVQEIRTNVDNLGTAVSSIQGNVSTMQGKLDTIGNNVVDLGEALAARPVMSQFSGVADSDHDSGGGYILDHDFPTVMHVTLTLAYAHLGQGVDENSPSTGDDASRRALYVQSQVGDDTYSLPFMHEVFTWHYGALPNSEASGFVTLEFDARSWSIHTTDQNCTGSVTVYYDVTEIHLQ